MRDAMTERDPVAELLDPTTTAKGKSALSAQARKEHDAELKAKRAAHAAKIRPLAAAKRAKRDGKGYAKSFPKWVRAVDPVALRVEYETHEGDPQERVVKIRHNKGGHPRHTEAIAAVESFRPLKCEALDENGDTLGVWDWPENYDAGEPTVAIVEGPPGHTLSGEDSEQERLLKVFAHILADAHKASAEAHRVALDKVAGVVEMQARHFADERKAMASQLLTYDRAFTRMQRDASRPTGVRVAVGDPGLEAEEPEEIDADNGTNEVVNTMIATVGTKVAEKFAEKLAAHATGSMNGAAPKEGS
jgi:hypothetical protein